MGGGIQRAEMSVGESLLAALAARYAADEMECDATLGVYVSSPVGIGEHPQHLEEMDKLVARMVDARDKRRLVEGILEGVREKKAA